MTIETPPSGRVEVCVEVTSTEVNDVELVVLESEVDAVPDVVVESVVPSVAEEAVMECQSETPEKRCSSGSSVACRQVRSDDSPTREFRLQEQPVVEESQEASGHS